MKLGFGTHKNKELSIVPENYLRWLLASMVELTPAIKVELERRKKAKSQKAIKSLVARGGVELAAGDVEAALDDAEEE